MRTFFNLTIAACLAAVALMTSACGSDDVCTGTPGCTVPPTCGDGVCQADKDETAENCPEDCVPSTCGNGVCDTQESALNCAEDCSATCVADPQRPQYCPEDGLCWPENTDCTLPVHTCGGEPKRCENANSTWSCCAGTFHECPASFYWCPSQNSCISATVQCPGGVGSCVGEARSCMAP